MSKKEKAAETFDSVSEKLGQAKATRDEAKKAFHAFLSENKLKIGTDYSDHKDAKIAKKFKSLHGAWADARTAVKDLEAKAKELKPAVQRVSKYEYPADVETPEQKKKYRAKMRAEAKAADKPAKAEKKADKKAEKAGKADKADKKSEKAGKKGKKSDD